MLQMQSNVLQSAKLGFWAEAEFLYHSPPNRPSSAFDSDNCLPSLCSVELASYNKPTTEVELWDLLSQERINKLRVIKCDLGSNPAFRISALIFSGR
jgi:hypothetical protein